MKKILVLFFIIFSALICNAQISALSINDTIAVDQNGKISIGIIKEITPVSIEAVNPKYGTSTVYYFGCVDGIYDYNIKKAIVISKEDFKESAAPNQYKSNTTNVVTYKDLQDKKTYNYIKSDYDLADKCFTAGIATISIGGFCELLGLGLYLGGRPHDITVYGKRYNGTDKYGNSYTFRESNTYTYSNENMVKAGYVFAGIGGSFISVSIPLLCFGDNMKRSCNRDFKLLEYINNK